MSKIISAKVWLNLAKSSILIRICLKLAQKYILYEKLIDIYHSVIDNAK